MAETNSTRSSIVEIKDITAGAGALGLLGYGMPGVLISLANAGIIEAGSMIIAMAIFMGGFAMFTAGLIE
jgi:succinate-acetate transporter protein